MMEMVNRARGYLEVSVTGVFPERFINLCAARGLSFWSVRKTDATQYRFLTTKSAYPKLEGLAKSQSCELRILRQQGAPFFSARFKKRYALCAGLLLWLLCAGFMGQFIWEIEVQGNTAIPDETILQALSELGVRQGAYTGSIEEREIKNLMALKVDGLLWCALNISGGRATLMVRERVEPEPVIRRGDPCDVIARESGVLVRMDTLSGSAQVQNGQTVRKGQILVSGVIQSEQTEPRTVHAMAYAIARTWRDVTAVTPESQLQKQYTGNEKRRFALVALGRRRNLYRDGGQPFDNCDKISISHTFDAPLGVRFPIRLITETYSEYIPEPLSLAESAAAELLETFLTEQLEEYGGDVSDLRLAFENRGGLMGVRMTAELLRDIAEPRDILTIP